MRKTAIIGGGQSGLQLAMGLLQKGHEVTVVSNRTPEQIRKGRVTSSQFMFHDSLQNERDLGIGFRRGGPSFRTLNMRPLASG